MQSSSIIAGVQEISDILSTCLPNNSTQLLKMVWYKLSNSKYFLLFLCKLSCINLYIFVSYVKLAKLFQMSDSFLESIKLEYIFINYEKKPTFILIRTVNGSSNLTYLLFSNNFCHFFKHFQYPIALTSNDAALTASKPAS